MNHTLSSDDKKFKQDVESCAFPASNFDHRAHLRLAYVYLIDNNIETSNKLVREALYSLLRFNNIEPTAKYHETLTRAWLLAVNYFMSITKSTSCADVFIDNNPQMLDSQIMMTHYTKERLFSDKARKIFIEPDLETIPM